MKQSTPTARRSGSTPARTRPTRTWVVRVLNQGNLDDAITALREAIRRKPDEIHNHFSLAYALQMQEKLDEAITEYRETIRLKPDYAEAHYNLGTALAQHEMPDEAEKEFAEARRLKPGIDDDP